MPLSPPPKVDISASAEMGDVDPSTIEGDTRKSERVSDCAAVGMAGPSNNADRPLGIAYTPLPEEDRTMRPMKLVPEVSRSGAHIQ